MCSHDFQVMMIACCNSLKLDESPTYVFTLDVNWTTVPFDPDKDHLFFLD